MVALLLCFVLAAAVSSAQDASVRSEVDARKLGVQDQVELTLTLEGRSVDLAQEVSLPPLRNLRVVGGPSLSTQVSFVNGAVSQTRVYSWLLQPAAAGAAEVGPFRVRLASGEMTTPAIPIEVVAGSVKAQRQRRAADPFDPLGGEDPFDSIFGRRRRPAAEPLAFVLSSASRTRLHVGEPLLLTYSVCTTTTISDLKLADPPQYPGFWSEDLEKPEAPPGGEPATVDGVSCRRFPFLQKLLFPAKSGSLTIPASRWRLGLQRQSFFDAGPVALERATNPISLAVEPIPAEPGFSGAVGKFRVSAAMDRASLSLGDAATLRFRVEGSGNLKWIERAPEVAVPGAKVYAPQVKNDLKLGADGMSGSKTWEFVIVPETAGALEVPPLPFAYFDASQRRVVTARTAALPLKVLGAEAASGPSTPSAPVAKHRAGGPLALRSDLDLPAFRVPALETRALAGGAALALLLHAGIWGTARLFERRRLALGRAAPRRGVRAALAELSRAGRDGTSKEAAAALIERVLHDVFGPLEDGGGPPPSERERAAREILQEVHFIRYAPQLGDYSERIREVAARASEVVRKWA